MRGDREVYTPQAVVNGAAHVLGSDRAAIESAVASTKSKPNTLVLPVQLKLEGDSVQVALGDAASPVAAEVWLCAVSKSVPVSIGRGENSGRAVTYHNVIRRWVKLGDWTGSARTFSYPVKDLAAEPADAFAVIVQAGSVEKPGAMLGAAMASLR
jgi:hypothetical protein